MQPIIEIEDSEANYEADYLEICVVKMFVFETQEHILKWVQMKADGLTFCLYFNIIMSVVFQSI